MKIIFKTRNNNYNAVGNVEDGSLWTVSKGSRINSVLSERTDKDIRRIRETPGLIKDGILQKDVQFSSASKAAQFVSGFINNGMTAWKTESGEPISDYIQGKRRKPFKAKEK